MNAYGSRLSRLRKARLGKRLAVSLSRVTGRQILNCVTLPDPVPATLPHSLAEVTDPDHRVVRCNKAVFQEGAVEVNATLSRRHADIRVEDGECRFCRDGREVGAQVFRDGRPIEIAGG